MSRARNWRKVHEEDLMRRPSIRKPKPSLRTYKPPSARQMTYLRALTERTGQTFVSPRTSWQASEEIERLKRLLPS